MKAVERLLPLLDAVRQVAPDRWVARCPAHDDRSPSLSLYQKDDRALVHCHAGCPVQDVVEAIGLVLADLFDERRIKRPFLANPAVSRVRLGAEVLEAWRQVRLRQVCKSLRDIDRQVVAIDDYVAHFPNERDSDFVWARLAAVLEHYHTLETWLESLSSNDSESHAAVYREMQQFDGGQADVA